MKKIFLVALCIIASTIANATVIRSDSTDLSTNNWNLTTSWIGGVIPGNNDTAIVSIGDDLRLNITDTVARLVVSHGDGDLLFFTRIVIMGTNNLLVTGDVVINADGGLGEDAIIRWQSTGELRIQGDLIINNTGNANDAQLKFGSGASTLILEGALTINTLSLWTPGIGTVYFNSSSAQAISFVSSVKYNNVITNNSSPSGVTLGGAITTSNVTGNITVQSGVFDNGGFSITGNSAKTFQVNNSATFIISGGSFPTGFGTSTLQSTSTVEYSSNSAQTISGVATYGNLILSATVSVTKTLGANIDVDGNLTIGANVTLDADAGNNYNINSAGNWNNSGGFNAQSNTVTFDGTTSISGSSTNSFNNMTISGTLTAPGGNFNVAGNWTNNGIFTHNSGTVTFNGSTAISGSTTNFNNVTISGTLTASSGTTSAAGNWANNGTFTHNSGTINFNGTTALSGTSQSSFNNITISGNLAGVLFGNFNVAGNWNNTGTYTPNSGTVTFNGTSTQTVTNASGETFNNLTINTTGPFSLGGNVSVSNTLTMSSGNISTGTDVLTLGTSISNEGTLSYSSGIIIGKFERWINTLFLDFLFPVGTALEYRPSIISFNSPLTGGSLIGEFIGSDPGSLGLPLADPAPDSVLNQFTEGYWTMTTANGLSSSDYDLNLVGTGFTSYTLDATTRLMTRSSGGNPWTADGTHVTAVPDTAKRTGITTLSAQYAFGNLCSSPVVGLGNDTTVCDSVLLDADNAGATYLWSTSETTQTIYASLSGLNTYWVDVTASGCSTVRDSIDVTVNIEATVNLGNDTTVCDSILLDAENAGADYLWSSGETTQTIYASSTGTYWVNVTSAPCDSVRDSIVVTIDPGPTVNLGNDTAVCDSVLLDAGNCCSATYLWSTGETTQTIYASSTDTYWVDVTNVSNCTTRDSIDITIAGYPTVNLGNDTTVCDNILLDAENPGDTYDWSTGANTQTIFAAFTGTYWVDVTNATNCTTRDSIDVTINGPSPTVNLGNDTTVCDSVQLDAGNCCSTAYLWSTGETTQTIYASSTDTFWVDVTNNGCTTRDSIDITVNIGATVNLGNDTIVCDSLLLDADNAGATYLWSTGETTQTIYASSTGIYWVNVTVAPCDSVRDSIDVTVNTSPTVNLGNDTTVCDSVQLDAENAGSTYLWSTGDTTQTIYASLSGLNTYWVDVTNNGCTTTDSIDVTVNSDVTVNLGNDTTVCDSLLLDADNAGASYLWSTGDTTQTIYASLPGLNTYWVDVTSTGCATVRDSIDVTINGPSPTVNLGNDTTVCDSVQLDAGNCCSASYLWSTSEITQLIYAPSTGTYWVDVTENSCTTRDSIDVAVNVEATVNLGNDTTVCDSILLDAENAGADYLWSTGETTQTIYASSTGIYWVNVTAVPCDSVRDSIVVTVNPGPVVDLGNDTIVCDSVQLDAGNCCSATYSWSTGETTQTIYASLSGLNTYWVDVTEFPCTAVRDSIDITVHPVPTSSITGDISVFETTTHIYSVVNTPGYTYTWSLLQSLGTIDAGQGSNSITVTWNTAGTDTVRVVADSCGTGDPVDLQVTINAVITSTASDFWDLGTTWTGGVAPTANDSAVIAAGDAVTVRTSNATCATVSLNAVGFSTAVITVESGQTLTINGNADLNGSNDVPAVIDLKGTAILNVTGNINMNVSTADKARIIMTDGASTLNLNGNINLSSVGTLSSSATSTVNINGSSAQILAMGSGLVYNHININNSSDTVTLGAAITNANVTGNIKVLSGAFDNGGFSIATVSPDTFQVNNVATFILTGTSGWPSGFTDILGSTIVYGGGNQTVTMPSNGQVFSTLVIAGTGTKTLGETITVSTVLRINPTGTTLDASASDFDINLAGNWVNNGTFNATGGAVIFDGSSAQTIGGSIVTSFNDLTINNSSGGVSLTGAQNVTGTLTLTSGVFSTTGGQPFTLISNSSGTARIGTVTGGSMSGNFTMQRYIDGNDGWRFLTPPVSGTTLADWNSEFAMSGFPGVPSTLPPFTSVYTYDETVPFVQDSGYVAPSDISDGLVNGRGYFAWIGDALGAPITKTIDLTGTLTSGQNMGTKIITVTYTNNLDSDNDGWNLIGNPYPSDVSWDAVSLSNVTGFAYIYSDASSGYVIYEQGVGSKTIASHQAFWVKVPTDASASVTFDEADKAIESDPFLKVVDPNSIKLTLTGNGFTDETEIRFKQGATEDYDWQYDAYKLLSFNYLAPSLSSISADSTDLSINSLPELTQDIDIPIRITWSWPYPPYNFGNTATYTITVNDLSNLPLSACIILEDLLTSTSVNLRIDSSYTFTISDTTTVPRFLLHLGAPISKEGIGVSCNGANDGIAIASGQGSAPWDYTWTNSSGDTIQTSTNINSADTLYGLLPDTYTVYVTSSSALCSNVYDIIIINEPAILSANAAPTNVSCNGGNDGSATLTTIGGTLPYTYLWNDDSLQTTTTATGLPAGNYSVAITDNNGCVQTVNTTIGEPTAITTNIDQTDVSCNGGNDGSATLTTTGGTPPYTYLWNDDSLQTTTTATGLPAGNYNITITDNNSCVQTANTTINEPAVVIADFFISTDTVFLSEGGIVQFTNNSSGASSYQWDFGDGVSSFDQSPWHKYNSTGNYTVTLIALNSNMCYDSINFQITVLDNPVRVIDPDYMENTIRLLQNADGVFIEFNLRDLTKVNISIYNLLGQKAIEDHKIKVQNDRIKVRLPNDVPGVYFIKIETGVQSITKKIILP